jgi:cytochrome c oxidase subunit 3
LALTVLLGLSFTGLQVMEYMEAPFAFSGGGIYSSTFFLATGFHGFHVMVGTIFLAVCLFRAMAGQFTAERHFGFEAAAWYWHFVDVVWLFLFVAIYVLGAGSSGH